MAEGLSAGEARALFGFRPPGERALATYGQGGRPIKVAFVAPVLLGSRSSKNGVEYSRIVGGIAMARLLILLLTVTSALSRAAGAQAGPVAADTIPRVLDRVFDRWRGTDGPGCAVGVRWRGHPVYTRVYGMANLETGTPIRPSSRFNVASVSKQFTAMAILLLARDGRLSIDDDIRKYLPEIPNYGMPVTIRHLLAHTSGLRDPLDLLYLARGTYLKPPEREGEGR